MPQIDVTLELPQRIAAGLASGQLERIGGVIQNAASKQVVGWLREGGQVASNPELANGLLRTVLNSSTESLASTATGLLNNAMIAQNHYTVMTQLQGLTTLVSVVGGIGILNIATTAVTFTLLSRRLNQLERQIAELYEAMKKEFNQDRQAELNSALKAARNAFEMQSTDNKRNRAKTAFENFDKFRHHLWIQLEETFDESISPESNEQLLELTLLAMQIDSLSVRCHLEVNELDIAKQELSDVLDEYRNWLEKLVHRFLGQNRAIYFHESVSRDNLYRFMFIEEWLHLNDEEWQNSHEDDVLMKLLLAYRPTFWSKETAKRVKDIASFNSPARFKFRKKKHEDIKAPHLVALDQADLIVEQYRGLVGFQAEINAVERLGISMPAWEKQISDRLAVNNIDLAEHDDYVLLVDHDYLNNVNRLSD